MKRFAVVMIGMLLAAHVAFAQDDSEEAKLLYGPRVGASYVVVDAEKFSEEIEYIYSGRSGFFNGFAEVGAAATHLVPLGETENYFTVQEVFLIGALDQNIALPSFKFLMGFRSMFGAEGSVGPFITVTGDEDGMKLKFSIAYTVGFSLELAGTRIPISVSYIPSRSYYNPRITLVTGFDLGMND
jgi:hypothetical protein